MLRRAVRWRIALAIVSAILLPRTPAVAQSQATSGVIRGTVTSSTGEPVAGAAVTLRNTQTNIVRTTTTNTEGVFVAPLLAVGTYEVRARLVGATEARRAGVALRLGETVDLSLQLGVVQLEAIQVTAEAPLVDPARVEASTRLADQVVASVPNNGRNFLNLALLTPNVTLVQGPDGDELTVSGQRGIYNNISVDGADFNNPFFGEQRGGQRPAFTFNLDAVQEMVVTHDGANAEFGRSASGFVTVLTKSGTNQLGGSLHYFGQADALSASQFRNQGNPNFAQHQFGLTLGGPIVRDKAFFFIAYDQQLYHQTKQTVPLAQRLVRPADAASAALLTAWMDTAYGGALRGDFGSIRRTNDAQALLVKLDWHISADHSASLKYNYTNSKQDNGTFDVDTWARSSNAVEKDYSHAVNGSLVSLLSGSVSNEFRGEFAREYRPRPYSGPTFPNTSGTLWNTSGRPFPDVGIDYVEGFRFGMPFFIPVDAYDQRIQLLDNVTIAQGRHLFKVGGEFNRTNEVQTFIGFSNSRFIFSDVPGFLNYVSQGPTFVECSDGSSNATGACPAGTTITGPLQLFLQFAPVQPGATVRDAGTQDLIQYEYALFVQDSWKPTPKLTVNYGLRWEAQVEPDPITPASTVFFKPFIGQTINGHAFPSDGTIPSDYGMIQPRLGIAWDIKGDASQVLRANAGMYSARSPGLIFASTRTSNGSVGQTIFRASFFNGFGVTPPAFGPTLPTFASGTPDHPDVYVTDKNFTNPRTLALGASYERKLTDRLSASLSYAYAHTTHLNRFINRNDAVFGNPFSTFPGGTNGIGQLWTLESTAKSEYHGFTLSLAGGLSRWMDFQANYTLSFDKSDDDNERDPFSFRYARADSLQREYNWSDRDQRHRANLWVLQHLPYGFELTHRVSAYSAQPTSAKCGTSGAFLNVPLSADSATAASPADRICPDGHILLRNTLRKDNAFFQWDLRISRAFRVGRGAVEAMIEVFNLTNTFNFRNPSAPALLFNFDGTIRSGLGDPRRAQAGLRYTF
jgi:hypothetical protein